MVLIKVTLSCDGYQTSYSDCKSLMFTPLPRKFFESLPNMCSINQTTTFFVSGSIKLFDTTNLEWSSENYGFEISNERKSPETYFKKKVNKNFTSKLHQTIAISFIGFGLNNVSPPFIKRKENIKFYYSLLN